MSADELRQAAATLRERAEKASTGDGPTLSREWFYDLTYRSKRYEVAARDEGSIIAEDLDRWSATYIATMHPGVGLALAELLETLAYDREANGEIDGRTWDHDIVPLARLINGGAS